MWSNGGQPSVVVSQRLTCSFCFLIRIIYDN